MYFRVSVEGNRQDRVLSVQSETQEHGQAPRPTHLPPPQHATPLTDKTVKAPLFRAHLVGLAMLVLPALIGCDPPPVVRVYDAPKSDTEFVSGPLAGSNSGPISLGNAGIAGSNPSSGKPNAGTPTVSGPRRILGAILPLDSGCYFLKATDSPERLEPLMGDFHTIVSGFAIDANTGKPSNALPSGWVMNPRNDIALAEFVSPEGTGSIKFTVTALAMPDQKDWSEYLLSNVNRWRGQLKIDPVDLKTLNDSLVSVPRGEGLLPSYIFDATGTGSGGMAPSALPASGASSAVPTPTLPPSTPSASASPTETPKRPELDYRLPEGWSVGQGSPFRLATLKIESAEGNGEVTVSMATDNPQANTAMWAQQVLKESEPAQIDPVVQQTIEKAQTIVVGDKEAKLYTIRKSEEPQAPMLMVASIPTENQELHLFVKLIGDNRLAEAQKQKFIDFVQSISLK